MPAMVSLQVTYLDDAPEVKTMSSKPVVEKTCVWCVAATALEEKLTGLRSVAGKVCLLCVAAAMGALTLLAVIWTVILVSN
jgi:hypothetical protein